MQSLKLESGQVLSARDLNRIIDAIRQSFVFGAGFNVRHIGQLAAISFQDISGGGGSSGTAVVAAATITAIGADTVTCTINGVSESVAKPLCFQETYYGGQTFTYPNGEAITYTVTGSDADQKRTANNGTYTVTQRVTPQYFVGEVLTVFTTSDGWADLGSGKSWITIAT